MEGREIIKARGKYLIPGAIDTHVHLQPELKSGEVGEFLPVVRTVTTRVQRRPRSAASPPFSTCAPKAGAGSTVMDVLQVGGGMEDASRKLVIDFRIPRRDLTLRHVENHK